MDNFTEKQKSLIVGSLLGDGWLNTDKSNTSYLGIQHSVRQLEYLKWLKARFEEEKLNVSNIYNVSRKYEAYQIQVRFGKYANILRHQFYPNNNKTITRHHLNMLDEEGLAIWFMDDGGRCLHKKKNGEISSRELHIATHTFNYEEHKIIQKYLNVVWDINVKIYKDRKYFRLALNAIEGGKLIALISPYIHTTLLYKIDLQYKTKSNVPKSILL